MGSYLRHTYETDGTVIPQAVRGALASLTDDDLSVSSPVTGGVKEAAITTDRTGETPTLSIIVDGHDGDWTQTSEQAIRRRVEGIDGIEGLASSEGGFEG